MLRANLRLRNDWFLNFLHTILSCYDGFNKVSDKFIDVLFTKEGETVEEAKKRLRGEDEE